MSVYTEGDRESMHIYIYMYNINDKHMQTTDYRLRSCTSGHRMVGLGTAKPELRSRSRQAGHRRKTDADRHRQFTFLLKAARFPAPCGQVLASVP